MCHVCEQTNFFDLIILNDHMYYYFIDELFITVAQLKQA